MDIEVEGYHGRSGHFLSRYVHELLLYVIEELLNHNFIFSLSDFFFQELSLFC